MFKQDMRKIGDVYGEVLNSLKHNIIRENKQPANAFNSEFPKQDGGPSEKGGFHKALNDTCGCGDKKCKCNNEEDSEEMGGDLGKKEKALNSITDKLKNSNLTDEQKKSLESQKKKLELEMQTEEGEENIQEDTRKNAKQILNNIMTRKTLSFDKLYKSVLNENWMSEENAEDDIKGLGLDDEQADDEVEDTFGKEGDEVTFTLDRATAEKLLDVIGAAMGMETEGETEDETEGEDLNFGGEEYDGEEDEETLGKGSNLTGRDNKVRGKVKPKGGHASSDVTDEVGEDGDFGHAIFNAKQPNMGTGSGNKVSNYKAGSEYIK